MTDIEHYLPGPFSSMSGFEAIKGFQYQVVATIHYFFESLRMANFNLISESPLFTAHAIENSGRNAMPEVNRSFVFGYKVKLSKLSV